MEKTQPTLHGQAFSCPHFECGVYAKMTWNQLVNSDPPGTNIHTATCSHCDLSSIWAQQINGHHPKLPTGCLKLPYFSNPEMIYPKNITSSHRPHADMPENISNDFLEAVKIREDSPRGAAALLRLCTQKLCNHLGKKGPINNMIGELVKDGLPIKIQRSLDLLRITGNNAVHPGELNEEDTDNIVDKLFQLPNIIVEELITRPEKIETMFNESTTEGQKDGIKERDRNTKTT